MNTEAPPKDQRVAELTRSVLTLEAENIKLDAKARAAEQIMREPMLGGVIKSGADDWKVEQTKMKDMIDGMEEKLRELMEELAAKKARVKSLENDVEDVKQNTQMLIKAAQDKVRRETLAQNDDMRKQKESLEEKLSAFSLSKDQDVARLNVEMSGMESKYVRAKRARRGCPSAAEAGERSEYDTR
jgi:hypothetical protein